MAMNRLLRAGLKAVSYAELSVRKHYKLYRRVTNLFHKHYLRPFYKIWDHQIPVGEHNIPVRIFSPKITGEFPVLLFFHGGGWVTGNIDSYDRVCTNLARHTGCTVVSVDYRLAPEHHFPAAVEDCYLAAREVFAHPELLNTTRDQITLIGDSAGGNLVAAVCLIAKERGEFTPQRQILLYPATYNDHTESSPFPSVQENGKDYFLTSQRVQDYMDLYMSSPKDRESPYFAPLLAEDLRGQPRALIITAEYDPLRDEGEAYAAKLQKFGNDVTLYRMEDALHGFISLRATAAHVKKAYGYINKFLKEAKEQ